MWQLTHLRPLFITAQSLLQERACLKSTLGRHIAVSSQLSNGSLVSPVGHSALLLAGFIARSYQRQFVLSQAASIRFQLSKVLLDRSSCNQPMPCRPACACSLGSGQDGALALWLGPLIPRPLIPLILLATKCRWLVTSHLPPKGTIGRLLSPSSLLHIITSDCCTEQLLLSPCSSASLTGLLLTGISTPSAFCRQQSSN